MLHCGRPKRQARFLFCIFRSLRRKRATNPAAADLHVGPLDRRPGDAMRRLFLAQFADMRGKGVIEGR
jgi:hypothetical protein